MMKNERTRRLLAAFDQTPLPSHADRSRSLGPADVRSFYVATEPCIVVADAQGIVEPRLHGLVRVRRLCLDVSARDGSPRIAVARDAESKSQRIDHASRIHHRITPMCLFNTVPFTVASQIDVAPYGSEIDSLSKSASRRLTLVARVTSE